MATTKPSLLLIHGFPLDQTLWDPQREALRNVADVMAPDLRGFGSNNADGASVTMESFAKDLHDLLDRNGTDRVVLCGLSMGGYIAMAFLEQWPERVEALILCNTRSTADTAEGKEGRNATARDAREKGSAVIARAMAPKVLSATTRSQRPDIVAQVEAMIARQHPAAIAAASIGMAQRPDRTPVLRAVKVPALIITGDADELMPLPTSQAMADVISGARLVVLPNAGHLSNVEAPELFNATVRDFLASLPRA
jgi:3-oxoadipate enol-lactonase